MIINHIDLPYGFNVGSREPIDARFILSQADMAKVGDATQGDEFALPRCPEHYFVLCEDDGHFNPLFVDGCETSVAHDGSNLYQPASHA